MNTKTILDLIDQEVARLRQARHLLISFSSKAAALESRTAKAFTALGKNGARSARIVDFAPKAALSISRKKK
jgi:hypothetical protein